MKFAHDNIAAIKFDITKYSESEIIDSLDILSKYLFHNLYKTSKMYHQHFAQHEYSLALEVLDGFFWHVFCDNYLEILKDQVFNPDKYDDSTSANYGFTLYRVSLEILKMYAPFIPFVTEEIYLKIFGSCEKTLSIHLQNFNLEELHKFKFKQAEKDFSVIVEVLAAVRKLKSENSLSLKTEINQLILFSSHNEVLRTDLTALNLLLGATKCKNLVLAAHGSFINSFEESESGFVVHVNLESKE
jgi:valyl-tRNA synthetase